MEAPSWMVREPFDHQLEDLYETWDEEYWGILHEQGLGKSKLTIDTAVSLYLDGKIDTLLVYAPGGTYLNWIAKCVPEDWPPEIPVRTGWWAATSRKEVRERRRRAEESPEMAIIAANIESLRTIRGRNWAALLARKRRVLCVIDESTKIAGMTAIQAKAAVKLGKLCPYRRILTGSACSEQPMMLWMQAEFLKPNAGLLGFRNPVAYKAHYCVLEDTWSPNKKNKDGSRGGLVKTQVRGEGPRGGKTPLYKNLDQLRHRLAKFTTRRTKAECLDLPERVYEQRTFTMGREQKRAYAQMREEAIAILENEEVVSAPIVLAQMTRLMQISAGFLPVPSSDDIMDFSADRMKVLLDIIEDCQGKILIWTRYPHTIRVIAHVLREKYGDETVATYYGETKKEDRPKVVDRFEDPEDPIRFLILNQQVAGYQITLVQSATAIFFTNYWSHDERDQAEARNHRPGQKNMVTYFDIVAEKSIDHDVLHVLRNKLDMKTQVLGDAWRNWI